MTNTGLSVELQDLDDQIKSMIIKTDKSAGPGKGFLATCNVCGKQKPLKHMPQHIEANHITGVSHPCDICGKESRSRNALKVHKILYHIYYKLNCRTRDGLRQHWKNCAKERA